MKKSGFADWNTTTFTDGSASRSVISAPNTMIVAGTHMLIGGLLKVTVHRPGYVRSVLNCEGSGKAHSCADWQTSFANRSIFFGNLWQHDLISLLETRPSTLNGTPTCHGIGYSRI